MKLTCPKCKLFFDIPDTEYDCNNKYQCSGCGRELLNAFWCKMVKLTKYVFFSAIAMLILYGVYADSISDYFFKPSLPLKSQNVHNILQKSFHNFAPHREGNHFIYRVSYTDVDAEVDVDWTKNENDIVEELSITITAKTEEDFNDLVRYGVVWNILNNIKSLKTKSSDLTFFSAKKKKEKDFHCSDIYYSYFACQSLKDADYFYKITITRI